MKVQGTYRTVNVEKRNSGLFMAQFFFNGVSVEGKHTTEDKAIRQAKKWANMKNFSLDGFTIVNPKHITTFGL